MVSKPYPRSTAKREVSFIRDVDSMHAMLFDRTIHMDEVGWRYGIVIILLYASITNEISILELELMRI